MTPYSNLFGINLEPAGGQAMQNKKLPRREREKLRQRQEMLASALELFSEKGYHNVSMHEIAEKAEFAIGTLYHFFKNKEDLYRALILEQADKFHDALTKAIEEPDDEIEKLRNYVKAKGEVFRGNVSIIRLYFAETQGASFNVMAGLDCEIQERYGQFLQTLASIFESGMKRKRFKKIAAPYHLAVALDSFTNAFLFLWLEAPDRHPYPENPDTILNILFKGLIDP
jgi:TetR/AcrR family transcriptional regulator